MENRRNFAEITMAKIPNNYYRLIYFLLILLYSNPIYMTTKQNSFSLINGLSRFFIEVCSALFVSSDKKEFRRLKDFISS